MARHFLRTLRAKFLGGFARILNCTGTRRKPDPCGDARVLDWNAYLREGIRNGTIRIRRPDEPDDIDWQNTLLALANVVQTAGRAKQCALPLEGGGRGGGEFRNHARRRSAMAVR